MLKTPRRPALWLALVGILLLTAACAAPRKNWAGVAVDEQGDLVVTYDRFVAKLAPDGERLWVYPEKEDRKVQFYANPTIIDEIAYIGDYHGGVHAVDVKTGQAIWVYAQASGSTGIGFLNFGGSTDRIIGSVTVLDDIILVPDETGIFALDRATGKRLEDWAFQSERAIWSEPLYLPAEGDQPARLYVSALDHYLYSLNPESGDVLWKVDLEGAMPSSPTYLPEQDVLLVGTFSSELIAVQAADGQVMDHFTANGWVWKAPVIYEDMLYFSDLGGYLHAFRYDQDGFQDVWVAKIGEKEGRFRSAPLVTDDLLIVGSDDQHLYGVNRLTGAVEWKTEVKFEAISDLVTVQAEDETLVILTTSESKELVMGFRLDNGNKRWTYEHKD